METILTTDCAPHAEAIAHRLAQVCAVVYVAGYLTGAWLHRLNDRLAGRTTPPPQPVIIQRQFAVATPSNIAPPVLVHISDPMLRAIRLVRVEGRSQRLAASLCGVSRSSLQRALKA